MSIDSDDDDDDDGNSGGGGDTTMADSLYKVFVRFHFDSDRVGDIGNLRCAFDVRGGRVQPAPAAIVRRVGQAQEGVKVSARGCGRGR